MKNFLLPVLTLLFILTACKDEPKEQLCWDATNPDCENYDPCLSKNPVTAEFVMNERLGRLTPYRDILVPDTIFSPKSAILFTALEKKAQYKWYLGQDVISGPGDSIVERTVGNLPPGRYTAALVVQKEPDSLCFPKDDGRDSVFKTFTVVEFCDLMIHNRFKGVYEDSPNDSVEIEFFFANLQGTQPCEGNSLFAAGLFNDNQDPTGKWDTLSLSGTGAGLSDSRLVWSSNGDFNGIALLDRENETLALEFSYKLIQRKFTGTVKN